MSFSIATKSQSLLHYNNILERRLAKAKKKTYLLHNIYNGMKNTETDIYSDNTRSTMHGCRRRLY